MKLRIIVPGVAVSLAISLSVHAQVGYAAIGSNEGGGQTSQPGETSRYTLNHAEVGIYGDYFRLAPTNANYVGVGGRLAFSLQPNFGIEGEMNYDFARNYTSTYSVTNGTTTTTTFVTSSVRPVTGLFGPKLQFGTSGPIRAFITGKVGFVDFSFSNPNNVTGTQFSNSVNGIGGSGTHLALYPGGGLEGFMGPVGLRLEGGDEIYLNNGANNNIRVTVGPTIRF
jgi:hypothetical protein